MKIFFYKPCLQFEVQISSKNILNLMISANNLFSNASCDVIRISSNFPTQHN